MTTATITIQDDRISVEGPYHPDFPGRAKRLGGRWNPTAKIWGFDVSNESRVRALCLELFGTDGDTAVPTVMIRATWHCDNYADREAIYIAGRQIARAFNRDSGVKIGEGVIVVEGDFRSGGSRKKWATCVERGTIIEIRDIPETLAHAAVAASDKKLTVEIISQ